MTKQEEIREGIDRIMLDAIGDDEGVIARGIMAYLHEQGVVLRVERELPVRDYYSAYPTVVDKTQQDMLKAGYVATEPLVKR